MIKIWPNSIKKKVYKKRDKTKRFKTIQTPNKEEILIMGQVLIFLKGQFL